MSQDLMINEFMSRNEDVYPDFEGDYPDWIEIHNYGNQTIDLTGYGISDEEDNLFKWVFPAVDIAPQGFLLLFASEKDISVGTELHTNFKISKYGEPLSLTDADGITIHTLAPVQLAKNSSFGSFDDSMTDFVNQTTATPLSANSNSSNITSSHQTGYYSEGLDLELFSNQNQEIRFTTNGSTPNANSSLYTSSLALELLDKGDLSFSTIPTTPLEGPYPMDVFKWKEPAQTERAHVIRFASFNGTERTSDVITKTLIIGEELTERHSYSVLSICTDSLHFFDYDSGIYIPGARHDQDGFNWWPLGNYHNRGNSTEREIHLSWISETGEVNFESGAGIRMRGYGSASYPQKSMNLHFRGEYGLGSVKGDFFDRAGPDEFNKLTLRNAGQDGIEARMRDLLAQDLTREMDLDHQRFSPVSVYLNGEYWGVYHLRDKYDATYFAEKYDVDEDAVTIAGCCNYNVLGDATEYNELVEYFVELDSVRLADYELAHSIIDIDNFIDFQISEIYTANYDWPCNNYNVWRADGDFSKWRFIGYDYDGSLNSNDVFSGTFTESLIHATTDGDTWPYCSFSNALFRKLIDYPEFQEKFIERLNHHINTTFSPHHVMAKVDSLQALLKEEMPLHIERWGYPESLDDWYEDIDEISIFAEKRPCVLSGQMQEFFGKSFTTQNCYENIASLGTLNIVPNPNVGEFNLINQSFSDLEGEISIYDLSGRVIRKLGFIALPAQSRFLVNASDLKQGSYLVSITTDSKIVSTKMLILD